MKPLKTTLTATVIGLCLAMATATTYAQPPSAQSTRLLLVQKKGADQHQLISAQQAARRAQRKFRGRVLSVQLRNNSNNPQYAVKMIRKGQVKIIYIPARR